MRIETILNAMLATADPFIFLSHSPARYLRAERQYRAFRDRIIRMDAEKDARIQEMQDIYTLERILNDSTTDAG